ncbi:hypothetical protein F5Y12DRAFT_482024 [Xylaria sp. FL1777]|nr:hypothetical protein F5Y12DRAFT_482024 [Xylaria sp. FL1777]
MPRSIQRIFDFFARDGHSPQRESIPAESSRARTQTNRPPLEVLYPRPNQGVSNEIEVDIVAVHGLGSNVDWSWVWQDKKGHRPPVHWLKDLNMLPRVVPHARIIVYNYESRWHANAPTTRLELCGEELVKSLHNFRTDAQERPIVFIAHSLGGLVVLYGLLYADRTEHLQYLPASTVGFAPLGTPFRGTKMQSLAKNVAWLMAPMGSHDGIITELEQDSKHLADEVHAFGKLRNKLNIPTTCFFELYSSDYGKKIGLAGWAQAKVVEEESAHIPGWERVQLYADHFQLNKFSGPDDRSFLMVSNELHNMCANWKSVMERRKQTTKDRHFMVPFGRNDNFVGRSAILQQLLARVPPSANKDDCQRTAVEGLGGIGKTQIALETVYQVRDRYSDCSIFWVPAVDLTSFENAYREIGQLLQLSDINGEKADVKMLVKTGLSHENAGSWLLVIDNADDTDMLFTGANLVEYLPFSREGSILFTTRNHEVTAKLDIIQGNVINVSEMDNAEATTLLQTGLKESQISDAESTKRLLDFLANLPLAIKQASAYLTLNKNVTISQYLEFCESSNADLIHLLSRQFADRHRYKSHAKNQNPIATTWLISFEHITEHNPQAADCLKFACLLAQKDIPLSLLPVTSKITMAEVIGSLNAYAFITKRGTADSFDMHRLVRLAMQNWLQEKEEWEQWTTNVVERLIEAYPFPWHGNRKKWANYLPHGQAVLDTIYADVDVADSTKKDISLYVKIAESYWTLGKYAEAEPLFRRTLRMREEVLGKRHPDTLISMNNLALVLRTRLKFEEAEKLHRQQLEAYEAMKNKRPRPTLVAMNNLALVLRNQGKYEEAENLHRKELKLCTEVLGEKHPETLTSMNNLAHVLQNRGEYTASGELYRKTLELKEQVLGKKHPSTLISMNGLAFVLQREGNYKEAEKISRQELNLSIEVLGKEHPDTLISMYSLALTLQKQGRYQEAEELNREELKLNIAVLGIDHPSTQGTISHLAHVLKRQRKYAEAEEILALKRT